MNPERPFAACRRTVGLNTHRAAARLGITAQYLRRLELGRVPLSMRLADRMATAYGATIRDLTRPVGPDNADGTGASGRVTNGSVALPRTGKRISEALSLGMHDAATEESQP